MTEKTRLRIREAARKAAAELDPDVVPDEVCVELFQLLCDVARRAAAA